MWYSKQAPLLGLYIGADRIIALGLIKKAERYQLTHYAYQPLPTGVCAGQTVLKPQALVKALRAMQWPIRQVAVGLPTHGVLTKIYPCQQPSLALEAKKRLEDHFAPPFDAIYYDYGYASPSQRTMQLVVARREKVDALCKILIQADLIPTVIDVEAFALARALPLVVRQSIVSDESGQALLAIEPNFIALQVFKAGKIVYSSQKQIESVNRMARIHHGVAQLLKKYYLKDQVNAIERLYVYGMFADNTVVKNSLQQALKIEIKIANPAYQLSASKGVDLTQVLQNGHLLLMACGLAMRGCRES